MIERFNQLETREKIFLAGGAIFLLLALIYIGLYQPYQEAVRSAEKSTLAKQAQVEQAKRLQVEYRALQQQMKRANTKLARSDGMSALALMEGIAVRIGGREKLSYIRPQPPQSQGTVSIDHLDVKFERLPLPQVVRLLWEIESSATQMQIKNLRLKERFDNRTELDATMTVAVFRSKG